jgi:DHA2 family methylenomycin A resistance protein-like MFS transporter
MSLGYGVVQLDVTIVNTALNSIAGSLHSGVSGLQWVVSAYTIAFAAFILTAGALGDRIGAKKVFMAGFAVFTAASLACALAPTAFTLIGARALQGVGAAILVPNSLALLNHAYPEEARPVNIGSPVPSAIGYTTRAYWSTSPRAMRLRAKPAPP